MPQTDALFKRYRKKTVYVLYVAVVLLFLLAAIKSVRASTLEELEPSVSTGQETVKSIVTAGEMKSDG